MVPHVERINPEPYLPGSGLLSRFAVRRSRDATIEIRPLCPTDGQACGLFIDRLHPDDLRLRFAGPITADQAIQRLRRSIEERNTVLAAIDEDGAIVGVAELAPIADGTAEVALVVRSDRKGRGIGSALIMALTEHGRQAGHTALRADILFENLPMRRLAATFGFRPQEAADLMIELLLPLGAAIRADISRAPCPFPW